jgi:hypothetical protein
LNLIEENRFPVSYSGASSRPEAEVISLYNVNTLFSWQHESVISRKVWFIGKSPKLNLNPIFDSALVADFRCRISIKFSRKGLEGPSFEYLSF